MKSVLSYSDALLCIVNLYTVISVSVFLGNFLLRTYNKSYSSLCRRLRKVHVYCKKPMSEVFQTHYDTCATKLLVCISYLLPLTWTLTHFWCTASMSFLRSNSDIFSLGIFNWLLESFPPPTYSSLSSEYIILFPILMLIGKIITCHHNIVLFVNSCIFIIIIII